MSHSEVLRLLFPCELGGLFDTDLAIEGQILDAAVDRAAILLQESFADTCGETVADWERICGLNSDDESPLQLRRDRIVSKLRELGGLSRNYFTSLATAMGYTVTIDEPFSEFGPHVWRVTVQNQPLYEFRAGESAAGDYLTSWDAATTLEGIFNELKPAHSRIIFAYV